MGRSADEGDDVIDLRTRATIAHDADLAAAAQAGPDAIAALQD